MVVSKNPDSGHEITRPDLNILSWSSAQKVLSALQIESAGVDAGLVVDEHSIPVKGRLCVDNHWRIYFRRMECAEPQFIIKVTARKHRIYRLGELIESNRLHTIPRDKIYTRSGIYHIQPY